MKSLVDQLLGLRIKIVLIVKYLFCSFCSEGFAFPLSEALDRLSSYIVLLPVPFFLTQQKQINQDYILIYLYLHNN